MQHAGNIKGIRFLQNVKRAALSVLWSGLLFLALFLIRGYSPFGNLTLLTGDLKDIFTPFLYDFYDTLTGSVSIFYHPAISSGYENFSSVSGCFASPFCYLVLLYPRERLTESVNLIVAFQVIASAASSLVLFDRLFPRNKWLNLMFSQAYAFSGYMFLNYQNILWLNCVWIFPLLVLSSTRMLQGKGLWYAILLAVSLATNVQIGMMTLFFVLLATGLNLFMYAPKETRKHASLSLVIYTIIGLLLSSVALLPNILLVLKSSRAQQQTDIVQVLQAVGLTDLPERLINLASPFTAAAIVFAFFRKKPRWNLMKRSYFALLFAVLLLTALLNSINLLWHLGSYMCFALRYGYMIVLVSLCFGAELLNRTDSFSKSDLKQTLPFWLRATLAFLTAVGGAAILIMNQERIIAANTSLAISKHIDVLVLLFFVFLLFSVSNIFVYPLLSLKKSGSLIAVACVSCMLLSSAFAFFSGFVPTGVFDQVRTLQRALPPNSTLNRVKEANDTTLENASFIGRYGSIAGYLLTGDASLQKSLTQMGYAAPWKSTSSSGGTVFTDALLGIQYCVASKEDPLPPTAFYQQVSDLNNGQFLWTNRSDLPFSLVCDRQAFSFYMPDSIFQTQNNLFRSITGGGDELIQIVGQAQADENGLLYRVESSPDSILYLNATKSASVSQISVRSTSGELLWSGNSIPSNCINYLGAYGKTTLSIYIEFTQGASKTASAPEIGVLDGSLLSSYYAKAATYGYDPLVQKNGYSGTVTCSNDHQMLFLPVTALSGWHCVVNGRSVEPLLALNTFLCIPLEQGENQFSAYYLPPGLILGAAMSFVGLIFLILLSRYHERFFHTAALQSGAYWMLLIVFSLFLLLFYVVPFGGLAFRIGQAIFRALF